MINSQRKKEILDYLSDADYRSIKEISEHFNVSLNTTRRDINELVEENLVEKFYGGVSLIRKHGSTYDSRAAANHGEKKKIAQYAASLVKDRDFIFIDAGTTATLLVDYINRDYHLTIVTNNVHTMSKVIEVENWDLIVVGSKLKHSSHSLVNVHDWDYLNSLNLNKAFLATSGYTIKSGATNPDTADAVIKSSMMKRSNENFLLIDSSKFDQTSLITFAEADHFSEIITGGAIPPYYTEYFEKNNVAYHIV